MGRADGKRADGGRDGNDGSHDSGLGLLLGMSGAVGDGSSARSDRDFLGGVDG